MSSSERVTDIPAELKQLEESVEKQEKAARDALGGKYWLLGKAGFELGLGASAVSEALFTNIPFFVSSTGEGRLTFLGLGVAGVLFGLKHAGQVPEAFRRSRTLLLDSHRLRTSLTNALEDAIRGVKFRALETPTNPPLISSGKQRRSRENA